MTMAGGPGQEEGNSVLVGGRRESRDSRVSGYGLSDKDTTALVLCGQGYLVSDSRS